MTTKIGQPKPCTLCKAIHDGAFFCDYCQCLWEASPESRRSRASQDGHRIRTAMADFVRRMQAERNNAATTKT